MYTLAFNYSITTFEVFHSLKFNGVTFVNVNIGFFKNYKVSVFVLKIYKYLLRI